MTDQLQFNVINRTAYNIKETNDADDIFFESAKATIRRKP